MAFLTQKKIEVNNNFISPLDFTSKILFNEWNLKENEEEITVMKVTIRGKNANGKIEEITYNLHDEYCKETNTSSMARCTGYTATAAANMFLDGLFTEKGVFPPELVGKHESCFNYIITYLKDRDVIYDKESRIII